MVNDELIPICDGANPLEPEEPDWRAAPDPLVEVCCSVALRLRYDDEAIQERRAAVEPPH